MNNTDYTIPEVLAPAGDMESLESAVRFGADAVYVGGEKFGMRSIAAKFDSQLLPKAVKFSHDNNVKIYLTTNIIPRNDEIKVFPEFVERAADSGIDAFIVSDLGMLDTVKKYAPNTDIHISTQAGITNYATARLLYDMGAKRIIPARELSLDEIAEIRAKTPSDLEIECFVHGAMCVSFSGRCLLSNYLTGRDSNRGDCAQPCRWRYNLVEETRPGQYFPINDDEHGTYIMNSKDMCMLPYIAKLIDAGVTSLKIEGRAKSAYYAAVITNAYRCAVDGYKKNPSSDYIPDEWILEEAKKVSHREYCTGFFFNTPQQDASVFYEGCYRRYSEFTAVVVGAEEGFVIAEQRNKFVAGTELEVLEPQSAPYTLKADELFNMDNEPIDSTPHAKMLFKIKTDRAIKPGSLLRRTTDKTLII